MWVVSNEISHIIGIEESVSGASYECQTEETRLYPQMTVESVVELDLKHPNPP